MKNLFGEPKNRTVLAVLKRPAKGRVMVLAKEGPTEISKLNSITFPQQGHTN